MLNGMLIVNDAGRLKYAYIEPVINPVMLGGVIHATQTVITETISQHVRRIVLENTQILVRFSKDMNLVVLANLDDNTRLLEKFLDEIANYLAQQGGENLVAVNDAMEAELFAIMAKYQKLLVCDRLHDLIEAPDLEWLNDRILGAIMETLLLHGTVKVLGEPEGGERVNSIVHLMKLLIMNSTEVRSDYFCTVDCRKKYMNTNVEGRTKGIVQLLRKGKLEQFLEFIEAVRIISRRISYLYKEKEYSPVKFVRELSSAIEKELQKFIEDVLFLAAEIARLGFLIPERDYPKVVKQIRDGLFIEMFEV